MDAERDALVALYWATGGEFWKIKKGWCTDVPLSEWYGVKVREGRVVELDLNSINLRGSIPKGLGRLGALTTVRLSNNQLEGSIPKEMGKLGALTGLDLSVNKLQGSIPKELGHLGALKVLYLSNNKLEGSIPKELRKLGDLTSLLLYNNKLEGSIPSELGQLGALKQLVIYNNELEGSIPKELGKLGDLTSLLLYNNKLEGSIPDELGQLGALTTLGLSNNKLEGSIPEELGRLGALTTTELSNNKLKETFKNSFPRFDGVPWQDTPGDAVDQGLGAGILYLKDDARYGRTSSNRLKVVLVGLCSAGKTSLATRLEGRDGDSLPGQEERTVGLEIRDIHLKPSPVSHPQHSGQDLAVKLWDFAGHQAFHHAHQIFLTKDALYILVVDVSAYRVEHTPEEAIEQWIDIIQSRVPGAVILLVGTHKDALVKGGLCDERMKKLHQDVEDCKELGARRQSALDNRRDGVVRVVNSHDVFLLDCKSSGEDEINDLRSFIATVAYSGDYSFPSVESQIPTPWMYAFLTLEAIRRGADLRGVSSEMAVVLDMLEHGDPKTAKHHVFFDDALVLFKDLWKAMDIENTPARADEVFFNAIKLNEVQGWILLTNRYGSVDDMCDGHVNRSHIVLHVNPARLADVVRRTVDIQLVDSASMPKVEEELRCFAQETGVSLYELSHQQERFYAAGEVSKTYLKFLWLHRELDLGRETKDSPPLEMTEEDVEAMVGSLVDLRIMFPVRKGSGDVVRDRYVVGICWPGHVMSEVTPESILELDVGSAMFRLVLKVHGSREMPPGLIPRLLAWCGRGEARITACWRHGCCFEFKGHMVLLYESTVSEIQSSIVCCTKGDANNETAKGILEDAVRELDRLIRDPHYGFSGIELYRNIIEKMVVAQDHHLDKLAQRLQRGLEDHINLSNDRRERQSERIADGVNAYLHVAQGGLNVRSDDIENKTDFVTSLASLTLSSKDEYPCPRLIWVEEDRASSTQSPFVRNVVPKRRKFSATRFRVRFLCAHDYTLVECGADGNDYVLEQTIWQRGFQKFLSLLQMGQGSDGVGAVLLDRQLEI